MFVHSMQIIEVGGEVPLMTKPSRLSFDAKQTSFLRLRLKNSSALFVIKCLFFLNKIMDYMTIYYQ